MGIGGISIWQLVIIAVIVALLFGTKKLRSVGSDLGSAVKGFKKAVSDEENKVEKPGLTTDMAAQTKEAEQVSPATEKDKA